MEADVLERVLEPRMTADEVYETVPNAVPEEPDFTQHRKCGHWRS